MYDHLFHRLKHQYLLAVLLATRLCGSIGGVLVIYYVNLTLTLEEPMRSSFIRAATLVVVLAVALATGWAFWETRHLRAVLKMFARGERPDDVLADAAGREAVIFPVRHHRTEAWLVPLTTLVPVAIFLLWVHNVSLDALKSITLAVFMGIGLSLMSAFFIIERCMQPVVRYLLDQGVRIDFERLPSNHLRNRLTLCFGLIILITALMIGTLAHQRAADIINKPRNQDEAVASLRVHTTYITLTAIMVGLIFSTTISRSVTSRVDRLLQAMKRVEQGQLSQELRATGNDEIDVLTRQFNSMVQQLAQHDATIRDLNVNLERKVEERTLSLRLLHAELDERNTELESAFQDLQEMQSQLVDVAHRAGMTEIATGVLHNVGNVLNSVNVSITLLEEKVQRSKIPNVRKVADLMQENAANFTGNATLQKLPQYLTLLSETLGTERQEMSGEIRNLVEKVQHIKNIISAQQNYTRRVSYKEHVDLEHMMEDLLSMHVPLIQKHNVYVEREFQPLPRITIEKSKLLQVLDNLIKNGIEAMSSVDAEQHVLKIRIHQENDEEGKGEWAVIRIADSGHGIETEALKNVFRFGFTTKHDGNGFGLHSAAIAMSEIGGSISVASDGRNKGATFTVTVPMQLSRDSESAPTAQPPTIHAKTS